MATLWTTQNSGLYRGRHNIGDPGAASLFEGQKGPWELTLTEPVPEIFEFVPLIGQKKAAPESPRMRTEKK